jgi:hypothetical protein
MWILPETNEFVFDHPFRAYVCGPSNSGKTKLLENILLNREKLINKPIDRIVFCFREDQDSYKSLRNDDIEFHKGLIDSSIFDPKFNNLLIIDDLMDECKDSKEILKLFTVESHHRNISVFLVSQNIYTKGQCSRDINLNSSNMIIFKNPRDNIQISVLARQMFPNKSTAFMEAFRDATSIPHGYLFLDFNQKTNDKLRLQTNILRPNRVIYVIDN